MRDTASVIRSPRVYHHIFIFKVTRLVSDCKAREVLQARKIKYHGKDIKKKCFTLKSVKLIHPTAKRQARQA